MHSSEEQELEDEEGIEVEEGEEEDMKQDSHEEDDDYKETFQSQRSSQRGPVIRSPTRHAHPLEIGKGPMEGAIIPF